MKKRTVTYLRHYHGSAGTQAGFPHNLAQAVQDRGDIPIGTYADDGRITGRGKYANWRRLLADLGDIDEIVLPDVGDLPGRTVGDLLGVLATLTDRGVTMAVPSKGIDTGTSPAAVLALIRVYRAAKKSAAIKTGQQRARVAGKHVGRPPIPESVRRRIVAELAGGGGIRPTAKKFGVAPASVVNIRRTMVEPVAEAA